MYITCLDVEGVLKQRILFLTKTPWNSNNSKGSWRIGNVLG